MRSMAEFSDEALRGAVYDHFIEYGVAPAAPDLMVQFAINPDERMASYQRLAAQRALVLDDAGEIAMAIPFSATPTDVLVRGAGVTWWANCAFDGIGIPALLGVDAVVETACPNSGVPIIVTVRNAVPTSDDCVLHMAVPLAQWWDNIGDT